MADKKDQFIEKVQKMFGPKHVRVLQHLYSKPPTTFRINVLKASPNEVLKSLKLLGFGIKPGPIVNSYIVDKQPQNLALSETQQFEQGLIYIQRLSSMVPVTMLQPQEGERILDMCAAPGSKTTQIAEMTKGMAQIIAADNNKERIYKLESNLQKYGVHADVITASGEELPYKHSMFIDYFDRILIDAPCSNEGMICITDPDTYKYWNPKLPKRISKLQKKLVAAAIKMLKAEGTLVYSTCTFSKEENENIVIWVLDNYKEMSLLEVKKILPDGNFTGFFAAKFLKLF